MSEKYHTPAPIVLAGILFMGFVAGGFAESMLASHEHTEEPINVSQMRSELSARCVTKPDVIAEIQDKLPDNNDGLITPDTLRTVLRDVVSHC